MTTCCKELYCPWKIAYQGQSDRHGESERGRKKRTSNKLTPLPCVVATPIITAVLIRSNNDVIAGVWLIVMVTSLWRRWVSPRLRQLLLITRSLIPKNLQRWSQVHSVNPSWSSIHNTFHPSFSSFFQPEFCCSSQLSFLWPFETSLFFHSLSYIFVPLCPQLNVAIFLLFLIFL